MKKLKIGIIGAGRIGKVHTETIVRSIPNADVVSIADTNIIEAEKLIKKFGIDSYSGDYKDIIDNTEIDAVVICSPTNTHAQYIIEAAQAGKHIFGEKPIALNLDTIQTALNMVDESNV